MSLPRKNSLGAFAMGYLTAYLLSLGMSLTLIRALMPTHALWPGLILCAVFSLAFHGLFFVRFKYRWLLPLGIAAVLGIWAALGGGPLFTLIQLAKAAFLSFQGVPDAVSPYADTARWAVCLMFSLLAAALAWDRTLPLALFTVLSVIALSFVLNPDGELLLCALPAAAGLLLLAAGRQGKRPSLLPVALLLPLLAFSVLPQGGVTVQPLKDAAEYIRNLIEDYLLFNEYRASFSLQTEGYQPLDERLGGPAQPEDHSVMEVRTSRTVLLRAKTYDDYTGLNWYDTLSARRYLAASPRFQTLREDLFDLNRPLAGDGSVSPETVKVHILNNGTTTLFAPARTRTLQLDGDRMVLYFNTAGELFLTRNLAPGDEYTITYMPFLPGSKATETLVRACADADDPRWAEVSDLYTAIPRHIQQEIYDIAAKATAGCTTPYEKAMGIQSYLRANYAYTLNTQVPPDGVDFLAWFLIGEKQGYCTYFATAMTMLCRVAGLPARYVTGYLAIPDENGVAYVTGENAHAWTEVYLNGFGWLDFDATPRSDSDRGGDSDGSNPPPSGSDPTPSPSPSPSPTPSPEPQQPEETPTPEPNGNEDEPTPTPEPEPAVTPEPTPDPAAPPPDKPDDPPPFPWWILALLLLILLAVWRYLVTEPLRRAQRHPDQAAAVLFSAVCALLSRRKLTRRKDETLRDFALRVERPLKEEQLPSLLPLADAYGAQLYGNHPASAEPFRDAYLRMRAAASPGARFVLAMKRLLPQKQSLI